MHAETISTPAKSTTWILAADGKQVHVYECYRVRKIIPMAGTGKHPHHKEQFEWELSPLPSLFRTAENPKDYQMGHDHRGSIFSAATPARHTVEPHVNIQEDLKRQFMRSIAMMLRQAYLRKHFDHLIIAAPPKLLGELRKHLGPEIMKWVVAELPKELTRYRNHELLAHVKHALPPVLQEEIP